jgi:hypothetical protein
MAGKKMMGRIGRTFFAPPIRWSKTMVKRPRILPFNGRATRVKTQSRRVMFGSAYSARFSSFSRNRLASRLEAGSLTDRGSTSSDP